MKMKRGWRKALDILNSKPVIGCFIFIILGLASVLAGNVIIQDGAIEVGDDLNASGVLFVNQSGGNVGIGTTSPDFKLETVGVIGSTGAAAGLTFQERDGAGDWVWYSDAGMGYLWTGAENAFSINATTGNVGIGTTSPGSKLHVGGNAYFSADVSALTFTDRTPYPSSLQEAYDALNSVEGIETINGTTIDKEKLHPILKSGEDGRSLSMSVSVLMEVNKDLVERVDVLEQALCNLEQTQFC